MISFDRLLTTAMLVVGGIMLSLMMIQISLDALLRTVFSRPLPATVEIVSNYYMVGLSFLPIALAQRYGRQLEASFLYSAMPVRGQKAANVIARLMGIAVYAALTWQSLQDAIAKTRVGAFAEAGSYSIPIWPCYWILPFSFVLLILVLILPRRREPAAGDGAGVE